MTPTLNCEAVADRGLVERYLANRLSDAELEGFETHFLTCDRCQQAIMLGATIRTAWPQVRPAPPRRRWIAWGAGVGLAAAVVLLAVLSPGPSRPSGRVARLGELVQAPIYLGIPVRAGPAGAADSLFETAMTAYVSERFDQAVPALRVALAAGVDPAPAEFFLGSSLLMTKHAAEAAAEFAKVIALGDTPYLAEAHFYRAKALLRLGRTAEARAELGDATRLGGVIGGYARALADSVERASSR